MAREAGTSESTASRALKDDPRIGEGTRAAVRASATALGYVPNAAARSLRARRTHILGLLLDDLADPVHGQLAAGFEEAAAAQGYAVFMMTGLHDQAREERALRVLVEHRADGIALASCVSEPSAVFARMPRSRVVFVQPDHPGMADAGAPDRGVLQSDDSGGVTELVHHLIDRGYRRLAYIGAGGTPSDRERLAGVAAAIAGRPIEPLRVYDAGLAGWRDPTRIAELIADDRPDAAVCYDDKLALAVMDTLRLTPLGVPDDLAIVGFDGIAQAARSRPRLTTVAVPSVELGRLAVGMLIASMRDGVAPPSKVLPVRLVVGETTPWRTDRPTGDRGAAAVAIAGGPA